MAKHPRQGVVNIDSWRVADAGIQKAAAFANEINQGYHTRPLLDDPTDVDPDDPTLIGVYERGIYQIPLYLRGWGMAVMLTATTTSVLYYLNKPVGLDEDDDDAVAAALMDNTNWKVFSQTSVPPATTTGFRITSSKDYDYDPDTPADETTVFWKTYDISGFDEDNNPFTITGDDAKFSTDLAETGMVRYDRPYVKLDGTLGYVMGVEGTTAIEPALPSDAGEALTTILVTATDATQVDDKIQTRAKDGVTGEVRTFNLLFQMWDAFLNLIGLTRLSLITKFVTEYIQDSDTVTVEQGEDGDGNPTILLHAAGGSAGGNSVRYQLVATTDGQTVFTLPAAIVGLAQVFTQGLHSIESTSEVPSQDYTLSGTTLTFAAGQENGTVVTVYDIKAGGSGGGGGSGNVPAGGTTGQVLKKNSNTNYDTVWANETAAGASALDDLTDVDAPAPTNLQALTYNTSTGKWEPKLFSGTDLNYRNVKSLYGAKGDGKYFYTGAITSGSSILTCTSASFTSADIGKKIKVQGAGPMMADFVSTIAGVSSSTIVTLADNASTTVATRFLAFGSDDTTALQTGIDTIISNRAGTLFFPSGIYIVAGAVGGVSNSQLRLPALDLEDNADLLPTIAFMGECMPNFSAGSPLVSEKPSITGSIIHSFGVGSGSMASILSGANPGGIFGDFTYQRVLLQNLTFRNQANIGTSGPTMTAVNGHRISTMSAIDCRFDVDCKSDEIVMPTNANAFGLVLPHYNNDAHIFVESNLSYGYYGGIVASEHAQLIDNNIYQCNYGLVYSTGGHASKNQRTLIQWCRNNVATANVTLFPSLSNADGDTNWVHAEVDQLNLEHWDNPADWFYTQYDLVDTDNWFKGQIVYHASRSNNGPESVFVKNGGKKVIIRELRNRGALAATNFYYITAPGNVIGVTKFYDLDGNYKGLVPVFDNTSNPASLHTSLAAYWPMNEASGVREDATGNGSDLTATVNAAPVPFKVSNGVTFSDDSLHRASTVPLQLGGTDFSIAFWLFTPAGFSSGTNGTVMGKWNNATNKREWLFQYLSGKLQFGKSSDGTAANQVFVETALLSASTAYFVCVTFNATTGAVSLSLNNGTPVTATWSTTVFSSNANFIVGQLDSGSWAGSGALDEVGIWKKELSGGEVTALYNSGKGNTYPFVFS